MHIRLHIAICSIILPCLLFCFHTTCFAQWYNPEKVNKKAKAIYEQAYDQATQGDYDKSLALLEFAIKYEPKYVEAFLSRAGIYADKKNYEASVRDFETALRLDSVFSFTYLLPYSISLAGIGSFQKALEMINGFLSIPTLNQQSIRAGNYRKKTYEFALEYIKNHEDKNYKLELTNLGNGINSSHLEYYPSVTIDGKKMIFTRRINEDEDFFESNFKNGLWDSATAVRGKLNTNLNEGAQNISQDGNWLIFTGCNYPEGLGSCDLYISYKTKSGQWTEAENLGKTVNTENWESAPSLSPDKKDLYFSSNRLGGYGGRDIWVTHRNSNGKWTIPENLGPAINTSADETCPFIHADNQSFYFVSNGHPGYGGTDIFLSKRDSNNKWDAPINLGYPINTIDDEGSLFVASDGKTSYYASDRNDKKTGLDIYSFQLRNEVAAAKTLWINGKVLDKKTKNGLPSTVILTNINNRNKITQVQTDEEGDFLITLPAGNNYAFNVNRKGYLFYSDHIEIEKNPTDSFFNLQILLEPIETGASIILKNIFFDVNESTIKSASEAELDKLAALLIENPNLKIQVNGHTDNAGKKEENLLLSLNRSKAVIKYLVSKGIASNRMIPKGFGDTMPISSNETEQGKSLNRRTEINIISN